MAGRRLDVEVVGRVARQELRWLWPGRIPLGKLTLLSGDPALGKSFLTMDMAARVSTGRGWPDGAENTAGDVLLLAAEDDVADTVRPRLEAAGADLRRVHVVRGIVGKDGGRVRYLSLERESRLLAAAVRGHRAGYRLIVIDPVSAYLEGLDLNRNGDVRSVLSGLADVAESSGAAVVLVSHHRKGGQGPAVHRTIGSLAFTAVCRAVWSVLRDGADPERRLFVPVKMNLGRGVAGMAFRVVEGAGRGCRNQESGGRTQGAGDRSAQRQGVDGVGRVVWEAEPVVVWGEERGERAYEEADGEDRLGVAKRWLSEVLLAGALRSSEVKRRARESGVGREALWRAKKGLGVRAVRKGEPPVWWWQLPGGRVPRVKL